MFNYFLFLFFCVTMTAANLNDDFKQCCKDKGINDDCAAQCTYDNSAPPFFFKFYHHQSKKSALGGDGDGTDACTPADGPSIAACCQKGKDNRQCCTDAGVGAEFDYCVDICNGVSPPPWDDKYFECGDMTAKIKECGKNS